MTEFFAIIDDGSAALKVSGNGNGGKLILAFDDTQLPEVLKTVLMRGELLKVMIKPADAP